MNRGASRHPDKSPDKARGHAQGAVQSRSSLSERLNSYKAHHKASFLSSLQRLLMTPVQTLMTSLVVAIALSLPSTLYVALSNIEQVGRSWDATPKLSAYLNPRARQKAVDQLKTRLESLPGVLAIQHISAEAALAEFQHMSGFGEALSILDQNPLPATIVVTPTDFSSDPESLAELAQVLSEEAIIDDVSFDLEWVRRLAVLMDLGKKIVAGLAVLLGLGVLLAIGNTIRLTIESRRDEIVITKLVGGTDGFVQRPFMYAGGWYGFIGGLLACFIVSVGVWIIAHPVSQLVALYQSDFRLQGLGFVGNVELLCIAVLLGWAGAKLAVGRHLSEIEPS